VLQLHNPSNSIFINDEGKKGLKEKTGVARIR
jgi:hypothetical protein